MSDHPDLEQLDPSVRFIVRGVFSDPANGTPDDISQAGCLSLAKEGYQAWNAWRALFPARHRAIRPRQNVAVFVEVDEFIKQSEINFLQFDFGDSALFKNLKSWSTFTSFNSAKFGKNCKFENVHFDDWVDFSAIKVDGNIEFVNCMFKECPEFIGTQISGSLSFKNVVFNSSSRFWGIQVGYELILSEVIFKGATSFKAMSWESLTDVYKDHFDSKRGVGKKLGLDPCVFNRTTVVGCQFFGEVDFSGRSFLGKTEFTSNTLGTKTQFFFSPPVFHQSEMHQDTSFENVEFPEASGSHKAARSYRTLKLSFSKQQAIREEQRFFRLEMAEEAARTSGFERYLYSRYKAFSDYGLSVEKPIYLLIKTFCWFLLIYGIASIPNCKPDYCQPSSAWFEFTLVQALPLPGLDKLSESLRDMLYHRNGAWSVAVTSMVILHKAISLLAIFLVGLGLRNLFKLK